MSLKSWLNRNVSSAKNDIHKIGKAIAKTAVKVVDKVEEIPFAPLLPFKGLMTTELQKRNITYKNELSDIAPKFYNSVVKKSHFDSESNNFEGGFNYIDHDGSENFVVTAAMATTIIGAIIDFIKQLKKKRDAGQPLTNEESQILTQAEQISVVVSDAAMNSAQTTIAEQVKDFIFSWKGAVTFSVLAFLIWMAYKGAKKG